MAATLIENLKSELELSERKRLRLQRRQSLEGFQAEDLSLWTMLDLMTLILVFFIILYADLLTVTPPRILAPVLKKDTVAIKTVPDRVPEIQPPRQQETEFLTLGKNLRKAMAGTDISGYSVEITGDRIMLVIGEKISFPVGQAELLEHIKPPLEKIAAFFNREPGYRIIVSGHTDNTPIHTARFPSNWELSVARALSVANFMMAYHVDPRRIAVEGFGQYRPVSDNGFYEGRQANRRVEISMIRIPF